MPGESPHPKLGELQRLYHIHWYRTKDRQAAAAAVREEAHRLGLKPPPNLTYPRLSLEASGIRPQPLSPLQGFYHLWQALVRGRKEYGYDVEPFKRKVLALAPRMGFLLGGESWPKEAEWNGVSMELFRGDDSLAGWVRATVEVRFWSRVLGEGLGMGVWDFLEALDWPLVSPEAWRVFLSVLRNKEGEKLRLLDLNPSLPKAPALELLALSQGGRIREREVREYLHQRGMQGVVSWYPTTLRGQKGYEEVLGYIGAYHLALLLLARYEGRRTTCAYCGQVFFRERRSGRYCSGRCRMAAFRAGGRGKG